LRLLVLGGTKFLGRAVVDAALAAGDEVTLFNRGETNPGLYPDVERLRGNRDGDLAALAGRSWDAVVDTSGYVPRVVRESATLLSGAAGHYLFVSSISVYADFSEPVDEGARLAELGDLSADELLPDYANYGPLKALCEREVQEAFPGRSTAVRAGLIVGPHDPTGRFTYWPHRIARGGEVLVPGPPDRPVQLVDVRDLAGWILHACADGLAGPFNVTAPPLPIRTVVETCREVTGSEATFTYVDEAFLLERGVGQWLELPLWVAAEPGWERFLETRVERALAAGLTLRPLAETVRGTLELARPTAEAGLASEREAELLAAWHERQ
jgi:2'-hydroxyisoflavone reductase